MITARMHSRLVRAGDLVTAIGEWAVAAVVILVASALAAAVGTLTMLAALDMWGRWF